MKKTNDMRHKTLKERLKGFEGEYVFEEWDTGNPVEEAVDITSGFVEVEH